MQTEGLSISSGVSREFIPPTSPDVPSEGERARAFWRRVQRYAAGSEVLVDHQADQRKHLLIVSGWACDLRILPDGRRQIFSFLLPGDTIDMQRTANIGARAVMALTRLEVAPWSAQGETGLGDWKPSAEVFEHTERMRELRLYDQMTRMGRLSAKERVIHLLLELRDRLAQVGLVNGDTFKIPLTQEVLADALGLSVVHINRTLKELRADDWVVIKSGVVTLRNRIRLASVSCYRSEDGQNEQPKCPPAVRSSANRAA